MGIEKLAELDERVKLGCKVWYFQANPRTRYNIQERLKEVTVGDEDVWEVTRYIKKISKGQIALIWSCGKKAGIYAIADIISDPDLLVDSTESTKHYIHSEDKSQKRLRAKIRFNLILDRYITGEEVKRKSLQGTNFPVSKSEWRTISRIIRKRLGQE